MKAECIRCKGNKNIVCKGMCSNCYNVSRQKMGKCERCKRERLIFIKGLCSSCYHYTRQNQVTAKVYRAKWKKNHPEWVKEYYRIYYQNNKAYWHDYWLKNKGKRLLEV